MSNDWHEWQAAKDAQRAADERRERNAREATDAWIRRTSGGSSSAPDFLRWLAATGISLVVICVFAGVIFLLGSVLPDDDDAFADLVAVIVAIGAGVAVLGFIAAFIYSRVKHRRQMEERDKREREAPDRTGPR